MVNAEKLITENLDTWSSSIKAKSSAGRGNGKKQQLYGIKKLRELILELAIRGLLVPQNPADEPASELLKKIAKEKAKLIKSGTIKKGKKFLQSQEELPFQIPDSWQWSELGEITEIGPRNALEDNLDTGFVPMSLISTSYQGVHGQEVRKWSAIKKGYTHFCDGDIAIAKITPCFENSKAAIFGNLENGYGAGTTELHVARPIGDFFSSRFILLYLKAPMFLAKGKPKMTGSAGQKRIPVSYFSGNPLPFPPLAEQHRIVAKVDELMALCDQLEQQQEDSMRTHQTLVQTLLGALTAASERGQFAESWKRIEANFDTLFTTESSIDELKKTILQLAVMGKLVPQDANDEPAGELLKRIAKKNANKKTLPKPTNAPKPLPNTWRWTTSGYIGDIKLGRQRSPKDHNGPDMIPYLRVANVHDDRLALSDVKKMNFTPDEQKTFRLEAGDILLNEGQSRELVGRPAIYRDEIPGCCFQNTLIRLRTHEGVDPDYSLLYFRSCLYSGRFQKAVKQTTNMAHLSAGRLSPIEFPLPPINEQHRIVAKVEELMILCDQLKANLATSQAAQLNLADSLVGSSLFKNLQSDFSSNGDRISDASNTHCLNKVAQ